MRSIIDWNQGRRRLLAAVLAAGVLAGSLTGASAENFGRFLDKLIVSLEPDGQTIILLNDFRFVDSTNRLWTAPKGTRVNGASIPRPFWSIIGGPLDGVYRDASVVHDYYCKERLGSWRDVHRAFYDGMRAMDVNPIKAKLMYYAVVQFGPRWEPIKLLGDYGRLMKRIEEIRRQGIRVEEPTGGSGPLAGGAPEPMLAVTPPVVPGALEDVLAMQRRLEAGEFQSIEELERAALDKGNPLFPVELRQ